MSHIADVPGISVGHATTEDGRTGTTIVLADQPAVAGVSVLGGAPGTRETDVISPSGLGPGVDAVVLSGGSAFGLAAADGAMRTLHDAGRGYGVGAHRVPIVPAAIVFDLRGPPPDYAALGAASCAAALRAPNRVEGSLGAGAGAVTARLKGGIGSAAETVAGGTIGALVVVNAVGSATAANGPWLRAQPFERDGEFGDLGPAPAQADFSTPISKIDPHPRANTTIAVIATDLTLDRGEAHRLSLNAQDGLALALYPVHTLFDGDTVFALSTGHTPAPEGPAAQLALGAASARVMARAVGRAMVAATAVSGIDHPAWRDLHASGGRYDGGDGFGA